jgi:hypothetical protein
MLKCITLEGVRVGNTIQLTSPLSSTLYASFNINNKNQLFGGFTWIINGLMQDAPFTLVELKKYN